MVVTTGALAPFRSPPIRFTLDRRRRFGKQTTRPGTAKSPPKGYFQELTPPRPPPSGRYPVAPATSARCSCDAIVRSTRTMASWPRRHACRNASGCRTPASRRTSLPPSRKTKSPARKKACPGNTCTSIPSKPSRSTDASSHSPPNPRRTTTRRSVNTYRRATTGASRQKKSSRLTGIVSSAMSLPIVKNFPAPSETPHSCPTCRPRAKPAMDGQTTIEGVSGPNVFARKSESAMEHSS